MQRTSKVVALAAALAVFVATPLLAQAEALPADPMFAAAEDAAAYVRAMLTQAADQMSEEDYAFRPAPEVRTFGQLVGHVADSNYLFCSAAMSEESPVRGIETTLTARADLQKALADSFAYCDRAYADMTDAKAKTMVRLMGSQRPVLAVLLFRTHHIALHYGNAITYMRMRGMVPPSSQRMPGD